MDETAAQMPPPLPRPLLPDAPADEKPGPAGFWRRLGAIVLDSIILGIVGQVIGLVMFDALARAGGYARVLGFAIALGYFGVLNSRLGKGQTLGKKTLGIRVMDLDGSLLSLPRSFLRYAVLGIPFFFNNAPLPVAEHAWLAYPVSLLVIGTGLCTIYLVIFDRNSRRGLHDLAARAWVVPANAIAAPAPPGLSWMGHYFFVGAFMVLALVAPAFVGALTHNSLFAGLIGDQKALAAIPDVQAVGVVRGRNWSSRQASRSFIAATAVLSAPRVYDENLARQMAKVLLATDPDAQGSDRITVALTYGFDMGIATRHDTHVYPFTPAQLE